jgi:hypothetical protein
LILESYASQSFSWAFDAGCIASFWIGEAIMTGLRCAVTALAMSLVVGACGVADSGARSAPAPRMERATVHVTNNNWSDVRIFAVYQGQRVRLGTVTSMGSQVLRIPQTMVRAAGNIRLLVDPIGSNDTFVSEPLHIRPGQQVEFTVQNHIAISTVSVW